MGFSIGIIGLPNVGKSTLFKLLAKAEANIANYPFTTIDPNLGVVEVPDKRLEEIRKIIGSAKAIPTTINFCDIAGLVKGASRGEGLGNKFLAHIREVDAIAHVVRCFADPNVTHVENVIDPLRDSELINTELLLADLNTVEKKLETVKPATKTGDKNALKQLKILEELKTGLAKGEPVRKITEASSPEERAEVESLRLLTGKPVLYLANIDENGNPALLEKLQEKVREEKAEIIPICAKLELELADLPPADAQEYLQTAGIKKAALPRFIQAGYKLLNLITFFTANEKECRAWTVKNGTPAPRAAGQIHSDMERGFIAAEVVHHGDLVSEGTYQKAREKGQVRTEGKGYLVKNGDLILFRFVV